MRLYVRGLFGKDGLKQMSPIQLSEQLHDMAYLFTPSGEDVVLDKGEEAPDFFREMRYPPESGETVSDYLIRAGASEADLRFEGDRVVVLTVEDSTVSLFAIKNWSDADLFP